MSRETRAVILGLFVVVLVAIALSWWRRPAAEFQRIQGFHVEVHGRDGKGSFDVPSNLVARIAKLAHLDTILGDSQAEWARGDVTPREILDAAEDSSPDKPGVIKKGDARIEVLADGEALEIDVKDEWDKHVHVRLPRAVVEAMAGDGKISTSEILRKLDELGPGDVVTIKGNNNEVTITAKARRPHGLHLSRILGGPRGRSDILAVWPIG
jgi:hypothetical protein